MDAKLVHTGRFFDLVVADGAIQGDDGLYTAVIVSLFSDRQAGPDDTLPDNSTDRRGWWADAYADVAGDKIGSRLWLLVREKQLPEVARRAEIYAGEALQWLIDDGIATTVTCQAEWIARGVLALLVEIERPAGTPLTFRFNNLWEAIRAL